MRYCCLYKTRRRVYASHAAIANISPHHKPIHLQQDTTGHILTSRNTSIQIKPRKNTYTAPAGSRVLLQPTYPTKPPTMTSPTTMMQYPKSCHQTLPSSIRGTIRHQELRTSRPRPSPRSSGGCSSARPVDMPPRRCTPLQH